MNVYAIYQRKNSRCKWEHCGSQVSPERANWLADLFTGRAKVAHQEVVTRVTVDFLGEVPYSLPSNYRFQNVAHTVQNDL